MIDRVVGAGRWVEATQRVEATRCVPHPGRIGTVIRRRTVLWIVTAVFLSLFTAVGALEIHSEHFYFGMPEGSPETNDLVIRDLYALSHNDATKFVDWVAYRLTPAEVWGTLDLEREWRSDPFLDADERLEPAGPDDYAGAYQAFRYDRGHLAPLGSFVGSEGASSVNYYSNIVPQTAQLNRGPWRTLEERVRRIVLTYHEVYVIAGTLYDGAPMPELPGADETHTVPTAFWKVIVVPSLGREGVFACVMPQRGFSDGDPRSYRESIDEIEARTGLDLFPHPTIDDWATIESDRAVGAVWE